MTNITVSQLIMDAQRMAIRVKDLDTMSTHLLAEAEGNNRLVESLRHFQDDVESLNNITNNGSNAETVAVIQQRNARSTEVLKENRELKHCVEDYESALQIIMQKYRDHTTNKVLDRKLNLKEMDNDKLWQIICAQNEKIDEMAAVMQHAAAADDDDFDRAIEDMNRLRLENKTLREQLQISKEFNPDSSSTCVHEYSLKEKAVQTVTDDSLEELSLSDTSIASSNNHSREQLPLSPSTSSIVAQSSATSTVIVATEHGSVSGTAVKQCRNAATEMLEPTDNEDEDAVSVTHSPSTMDLTELNDTAYADVIKSTVASAI